MTSRQEFSKAFLQSLPIWRYFDEMRTQLDQLKYDWQQYSSNLDQVAHQFTTLPNITDKQEKTTATVDNDCDIVQIYRKRDGEYRRCKDSPDQNSNSEPERIRNKSIIMLEEKVTENQDVFAMIIPDQPWVRCKVICVFRRPSGRKRNKPIITFKIRSQSEHDSRVFDVSKYCIARIQNHEDLLKPSKRVIAGIRETSMYAGIIGQEPYEENSYRYLVLLDDGSAKYYRPCNVYPILGQSSKPWRDSRYLRYSRWNNEASAKLFFSEYPKKYMMKYKIGDEVTICRDGMMTCAKILDFDCDTVRILYRDETQEYVYRGSPRWLADRWTKAKLLKNVESNSLHEGLLLYIHLYEQAGIKAIDEDLYKFCEDFNERVIVSKNHHRAKKSTACSKSKAKRIKVNLDGGFVDEDRVNVQIEEGGDSHRCTPECLVIPGVKTEAMVRDMIDEFRNESDLKVPLLLGWKRGFYRNSTNTRNNRSRVIVKYESPCGKLFSAAGAIRRYLINTGSRMDIDYFSFERELTLNSKNGEFTAFYFIENIAVDSKTGEPLENKNISLINQYSEERLPSDFEYRNESFPHPMLKAKGFSFNEEFKSSCDCADDCFQRSTCACHRLNEEFYGKNAHNKGSVSNSCQYNNKRLISQVSTGIFECNSGCKCSSKCSNRVVQNGIRFRLQVQKTIAKGWGVVTLDDIPAGSYICTYSAELLDDADQYGDSDMYYADLDYISVNEGSKEKFSDSDEGVESDSDIEILSQNGKRKSVPRIDEDDSDEQNGNSKKNDSDSSSISSLEADGMVDKYLPQSVTSEKKSRYPKRNVAAQEREQKAQANGAPNNERGKFKKIHDILKSHDFTLDARMQGNVGRFFNHSCDPNAHVQNVFIETHDLRFPIVSFFSLKNIRALDEITWNYNYKMGSIQGRRIDCHCGASNCRGRIL